MNRGNYRLGVFDIIIGILGIFIFLMISTLIINGVGKPQENDAAVAVFSSQKETGSDYLVYNSMEKEVKIRVYREKKNIVEVMDMEEYLKGVVAAEMPAEFREEALKAQGVAARTYALSHMEEWGGISCVKAREKKADICDSTHCQVFIDENERREKWGKDYSEFNEKISLAVESTAGEAVTYDGAIIDSPYYFAASSGLTENAEDVFKEGRPYLKSVDSYGDSDAPKYTSTKRIHKTDFIETIKKEYGNQELYKGTLMGQINIESKTRAGNVKVIRVGDIRILGTEFRRVFGLNSAEFIISEEGDDIIFMCKGYGHEVGMSQWGANGMAKIGKEYKDILTHYYSESKIEKVY